MKKSLFPKGWMKSMMIAALCMQSPFISQLSECQAQVGTWHAYMSYNDVQQIVKGGNLLYVRASNALYTYNLTDHSISTYDKVNALSDSYITTIAWNQNVKRTIIAYQNSNLDLMDNSGNVINISALYNKSMTQDKTINRIDIKDEFAYLSTNFGIVKINMKKCEVAESYILNKKVKATGQDGTYLYAQLSDNSSIRGLLVNNLIDPHNWEVATAPAGIYNQSNDDWNEYKELVSTLKPGGPKYNYFGVMQFEHDRLYTASGNTTNGCIQVLKDNQWQIYQDTNLTPISGMTYYKAVRALAVNPNNPDQVFAGVRNGLYEFVNGQLVQAYNNTNSPIEMFDGKSKEYQIIWGAICDNFNNVWCLNSQAPTKGLLKMNIATREWTSVNIPEIMVFEDGGMKNKSLPSMERMMMDSNGYIWFVNNYWNIPSVYCFNPVNGQLINYFTILTNQDGLTYSTYIPKCVTEDLDGNIWIATHIGLFMVESANKYTRGANVVQVKVPRNDGSSLADYLLSGVYISGMVVDGANRKWIATRGNGVYLISEDNLTQLENFTTENSPLISNNIESMAMNGETGELFFGTDIGLCSYMTDATIAAIEMVKDNVYAFPNPVFSSYQGLITVRGLTRDADVKILTTSGHLVYEGRSNGGTFTWNGRDSGGRRVASGIYMVATATSDGGKGVVCKIAFVR